MHSLNGYPVPEDAEKASFADSFGHFMTRDTTEGWHAQRLESETYSRSMRSDSNRSFLVLVRSLGFPLLLAALAPNLTQAAGAAEPPAIAAEVHTRAIVRSISKDDGKPLYIRLKLIPRSKIPFSTVTYRVRDARLLAGLREGDSVAFKAERLDGENVLTAIDRAKPCERFKECQ